MPSHIVRRIRFWSIVGLVSLCAWKMDLGWFVAAIVFAVLIRTADLMLHQRGEDLS